MNSFIFGYLFIGFLCLTLFVIVLFKNIDMVIETLGNQSVWNYLGAYLFVFFVWPVFLYKIYKEYNDSDS